MCHRLEVLERKMAFMEGVESQEGKLAAKDARIVQLEIALATCDKITGSVSLRPHQIAQGFMDNPRVLASHPPVEIEIERRPRHNGREPGCNGG